MTGTLACTGLSIPGFRFPYVSPQFCHTAVQESQPVVHRLRSRPHLRPRLTQGRSALPWKPWIFGLEDSHLYLATHSGILSSMQSTAPYGTASSRMQCSSTNPFGSLVSVARFSPGHFRRRTSRPVSYYALFECMAASEPTSWLSSKSHILFHLTRTLGP